MQRILVTGGAGYVGSICAEYLINHGHEVTIIDDLSTGHIEAVPREAVFYKADIGDSSTLSKILADRRCDIVFHFAAKALIAESVTDPAMFYRTNMQAAFAMTECLRLAGVHRFIFSSTAAVYGNPTLVPIPEDHPKSPVNSYGESKLAFEQLLRWYSSAYNWSVVAFRYFNACGATPTRGELHEPETHIIPLLLEAASGEAAEFLIYGDDYDTPDGTCLRDYVHVLDIANAHHLALKLMTPPMFEAFNIGTGVSHSVLQMCHTVEQITGGKLKLRVVPRRLGDPPVLCASPQKIRSQLGWSPSHSNLHEIITSAWEWQLTPGSGHEKKPAAA